MNKKTASEVCYVLESSIGAVALHRCRRVSSLSLPAFELASASVMYAPVGDVEGGGPFVIGGGIFTAIFSSSSSSSTPSRGLSCTAILIVLRERWPVARDSYQIS